jgi:competence protein ComEC
VVISLLTLIMLVVSVRASDRLVPSPPLESVSSNRLTVHYMDVGQGDATLLQGPDFTILVDAGRHDRTDVIAYLKRAGIRAFDLVIGTHPHADHIGQMATVIREFAVKEIWLSGDSHTSRTFERTLDAALNSKAAYHEPRAGEVFTIGLARIEVTNPHRLNGDFHAGSLAVRIVYGDIAFLFTGDAELPTEQAMIDRNHELKAHILQLGHHGSRTSSGVNFLRAVSPEIAVYSAGADNPYGHPHPEVIARLDSFEIPVYGTDKHGTIRIVTDGEDYELILGPIVSSP